MRIWSFKFVWFSFSDISYIGLAMLWLPVAVTDAAASSTISWPAWDVTVSKQPNSYGESFCGTKCATICPNYKLRRNHSL